jgi:ectoine hydroxylase-related dioxygenase (phytanoyl-CoA dioxygenase family)
MSAQYGVSERTHVADDVASAAEEIKLKGYCIFPELFSADSMASWREKIDRVYAVQEEEFGREALAAIRELDLCRAPLLYDFSFIELASHPTILKVARHILGDWIILHLQNAIINRPSIEHHQASWHRDLPHQNWVISRPLALSALVAIDNFSATTGCTRLVPFSHRSEAMPSEEYTAANAIDFEAPAGSVILFDSMLFHRAGSNRSGNVRRAVNHMYTVPILKQQYDFAQNLGSRAEMTPDLAQLLGCTSQVPSSDRAWREARTKRLLEKV